MSERYDAEEVTYAHLAVINLHDGRIAAGCRLSTRSFTEDGRVMYDPYAVCSIYYGPGDLRNASTRQAIPVILRDILPAVRPGTKLLSVKGNIPQFNKRRSISTQVKLFAGMDICLTQKPGIERSIPELMSLANDAIRREESVICVL